MQNVRILGLWVVVVISGCCDKSQYPKNIRQIPPSASEQSWFQVPKDSRVFQNQLGDHDTLIFKDTVIYYRFFEEQGAYSDCETYEQRGVLGGSYRWKHDSLSETVAGLSISGQAGAPMIKFRLDTSGYFYTDDILLPASDTTMTVNGVSYNDVSVIDSIGRNNQQGLLFRKVYYSKSKGFIKYISTDLNVWDLTN